MSNLASLFNTGLSGLNTASTALSVTGHNTANVNTAGYTRQSVQITSLGGTHIAGTGFVGTGSAVNGVVRSYSSFLTTQLNGAQSTTASLAAQKDQVSQIDSLLAGSDIDLGTQMTGFFSAVSSVANTPSDTAARQSLLSSAASLTTQFRSAADYLNNISSSVNGEIGGAVEQVNAYASQIAKLNKQITDLSAANPSQQPNDLLDQRDALVNQLSQLVNTKVVVQDGGQYNVFIGSGQTLVLGNQATSLKVTTATDDPTATAISFVNQNGTASEISDGLLTGGKLGGLIGFRDGTLTTVQNSVGRLAISLSQALNQQQRLGIDLSGAPGNNLFTTAAPVSFSNARNTGDLSVTGSISNSSALTTSDYRMTVSTAAGGALQYSVTRLSDSASVVSNASSLPLSFDGVTLGAASGTAQSGDTFLIKPTATGAAGMNTMLTDPADVAAASPVVGGTGTSNLGTGTLTGLKVDSAYLAAPVTSTITLTYSSTGNAVSGFPATQPVTVTAPDGTVANYAAGASVPFSANSTYSVGGMSFRLAGAPTNGDTFTIKPNTSGVSDGSNVLAMAALQTAKIVGGGTATFSTAYGQLVSLVGNAANSLEISYTAQSTLASQIQTQQQSVSGVNQDEETANLLMYQQMYQANAKVIQTASSMFDAILAAF